MNEPTNIYKGLSYTWTESVSDYPAGDGWTLKYSFANSSANVTVTTAASGDDHVATLTAATTGTMTAGTYIWISYAEKGSDKYQVARGEVKIWAAIGTSVDRRSHARKMLDAIEAVMESRATREQEEMNLEGKMLRYQSLDSLIKARAHYAWLVASETRAELIAQGGEAGNQILTVFRND